MLATNQKNCLLSTIYLLYIMLIRTKLFTIRIRRYMDLDDETVNVIASVICLMFLGHCAKTYAILANSLKAPHISGKKWLVIADDDTLLRYVYSCQYIIMLNFNVVFQWSLQLCHGQSLIIIIIILAGMAVV